jgi:putative phosphoesterase
MKIAICSDIHDNIWKLEAALPGINDADALLFCGDFCAPFTLAQLAAGFDGPVHAVFGNNDGDQRLLLQVAQKAGNATLHGQFADLTFDGVRIAVNHYPEVAQGLAAGGLYHAVCYGHDHTPHQSQVGKTLLLNPGEMMGRFGRSTYMLLDIATLQITLREVE